MIDLRRVENFWFALEEAGGSPTGCPTNRLALRTIYEWKRNLEMGRVFHDGRWVSAVGPVSNDGSRNQTTRLRSCLSISSRPKQPKIRPLAL